MLNSFCFHIPIIDPKSLPDPCSRLRCILVIWSECNGLSAALCRSRRRTCASVSLTPLISWSCWSESLTLRGSTWRQSCAEPRRSLTSLQTNYAGKKNAHNRLLHPHMVTNWAIYQTGCWTWNLLHPNSPSYVMEKRIHISCKTVQYVL